MLLLPFKNIHWQSPFYFFILCAYIGSLINILKSELKERIRACLQASVPYSSPVGGGKTCK